VRQHKLIKNRYTVEFIPTREPSKFYVIKTYVKGGVQTVNQWINGKLFYRRWEQYSKSSIAIIRGVRA
jgi:hypothetical protein